MKHNQSTKNKLKRYIAMSVVAVDYTVYAAVYTQNGNKNKLNLFRPDANMCIHISNTEAPFGFVA